MAISKLKSDIRTHINDYKFIIDALKLPQGGKFHVVEIQMQETAEKMYKATEHALLEYYTSIHTQHTEGTPASRTTAHMTFWSEHFNVDAFLRAIDDVLDNFNIVKEKYGHKTRYRKSRSVGGGMAWAKGLVLDSYESYSDKIVFVMPTTRNYINVVKRLRKEFYKAWEIRTDTVAQPQRRPTAQTGGKAIALEGVHDPITAVLAWVELRANEIQSELSYSISTLDLPRLIIDALGVEWREDPRFKTNDIHQKRSVTVRLGPENVRMYLDAAGCEIIIDALTNVETGILRRKWDYFNPLEAAATAWSVPFTQQAAAAAQYQLLRELMNKNKLQVVKKKIKTKAPSTKPRSGSLIKSIRASKSPSKRGRLAESVKIKKGIEKGQGKKASTSTAADLARLKKYIQGRLPAEVRRNMGRPALRNRTGRFSNSVQLLSLTEAQNTIMAKYTYLLSPYETFENKGKKRWPMAYNPKPLIAKSIRNLAQGRIEQKLTVRRV